MGLSCSCASGFEARPQERELADAGPGEAGGITDAVDQGGTDRMGRMGPIGRMSRMRPDQTKSNRIKPLGNYTNQFDPDLTANITIPSEILMLSLFLVGKITGWQGSGQGYGL